MISVDAEGKQTLNLGRQREQGIRAFSFDVSGWAGLTCFLTVEDPRGVIRPAGQTVSDGVLHWLVGNDATAEAGNKTVCVHGLADGVERRSALFGAYVEESHGEPGDAPEPVKGWIGELELAEAERKSAESARGTAEAERNNAEGLRRSAEQERAAFYAGWTAALNGKAALGQVMRKLVTCTITAPNIAAITITQDDAGQPLALTEAEIRTYVPANAIAVGNTGFIYGRINDIASGYSNNVYDTASYFDCAIYRTLYASSVMACKKIGETRLFVTDFMYSDGITRSVGIRTAVYPHDIPSITSIYMYVANTTIPMGTVIEVWGRVS